jgi:hypothetical protein
MNSEQAFQDIEGLVKDLEKKADFDIEEWATKTEEELRATDHIKCVECGAEKPEREFQKLFLKRAEGICKQCWFNDDGEEE